MKKFISRLDAFRPQIDKKEIDIFEWFKYVEKVQKEKEDKQEELRLRSEAIKKEAEEKRMKESKEEVKEETVQIKGNDQVQEKDQVKDQLV